MNTIPTTQCTYPGSGIRHPVEDGSGSPRLRIGAKPLPGKRIEILVKTTLTDLRQGVLAQLVSDVELADSCPRPPAQPVHHRPNRPSPVSRRVERRLLRTRACRQRPPEIRVAQERPGTPQVRQGGAASRRELTGHDRRECGDGADRDTL